MMTRRPSPAPLNQAALDEAVREMLAEALTRGIEPEIVLGVINTFQEQAYPLPFIRARYRELCERS